jgi:hypothetical protein
MDLHANNSALNNQNKYEGGDVPIVSDSIRYIQLNRSVVNSQKKFMSNYIRTTKYTMFSFLPMSLIYQFQRFSNIYFLGMTILQSIPLISPLNPATAIFPLIFVLTVSMIREGFEDYQRYKSDKSKL